MSIFDFLKDVGNYDERVVARYEVEDLVIDTARVSDGRQPYETAVRHPSYNSGDWVIVEGYTTERDSAIGHNRWVKAMTTLPLPTVLTDCCNAECSQLIKAVEGELDFEKGTEQ